MKKSIIILIYTAFCAVSCEKFETETSQLSTPADEKVNVATNLDHTLVLKLVNDLRNAGCKCGVASMPPVPALIWNNLLAAAALSHCKDMNFNNFFSHLSSNGHSLAQRINLVGYNWIALGENIANGQFNEEEVVSAWLTSEGHCKTLMNASFKEMGVAKEGKYWAQNFGAR